MKRTILAALAAATLAAGQSKYLGDLHQLTHGGQNAEAYWSPDGRRLIFQTTRPPYGCDQIFIMNADGSDQHLVSTGKGRTTCGYFLGDNRHIVYASTHLAGDACPANPDRSRGYVWGVFPGYDIFLADDHGKIEKRLTDTPGYDAEATVNWKTGAIVYTSLASGDLDLWTMKPDGSKKKQITNTPGYDGGGAFSRDGRKLVWRANYPKTPEDMARYKSLLADNLTAPMKMEIVVGDADGRNARVVTHFGCASFAPTFTPDGRKILFASNKQECDSRKFELYLMNVDGSELEQVTSFGGFTSFPEFSPDGKTLVFCSDKDAKERYEFNIFTAPWTPVGQAILPAAGLLAGLTRPNSGGAPLQSLPRSGMRRPHRVGRPGQPHDDPPRLFAAPSEKRRGKLTNASRLANGQEPAAAEAVRKALDLPPYPSASGTMLLCWPISAGPLHPPCK